MLPLPSREERPGDRSGWRAGRSEPESPVTGAEGESRKSSPKLRRLIGSLHDSGAVHAISQLHPIKQREKGGRKRSDIVTDPADAAEEAGLRYVSDTRPGYTRKRNDESFQYFDTEGKLIRRIRLLRIGRLAIPPAYHDIWICRYPMGIFSYGRDDRGRKQYRYHERWRTIRDENKYDRILIFRGAAKNSAAGSGRFEVTDSNEKRYWQRSCNYWSALSSVLATRMRRQNKSFGLTTMKDHHVRCEKEVAIPVPRQRRQGT